MRHAFFGKIDRLVDGGDVVCRAQRRRLADYELTDALGSFHPRVEVDGRRCQLSLLGNCFAQKVQHSVVRCWAAQRRSRAERRTTTISDYVECLLDRNRGPATARLEFDGGFLETGDDVVADDESRRVRGQADHRGMQLFEEALRAMWILLEMEGMVLEPFQFEYLQCFMLYFFKRVVGSEVNRYLHRALASLHLGGAAVRFYDPAFPDENVAAEMASILEDMGKRILVLVAPRRSGKSVAVDVAIALAMAFSTSAFAAVTASASASECAPLWSGTGGSSSGAYVLLCAHVLKAGTLHVNPVRRHLETLANANFFDAGTRISSNETDVTLEITAGGRTASKKTAGTAGRGTRIGSKSIFHVISGAPNVST